MKHRPVAVAALTVVAVALSLSAAGTPLRPTFVTPFDPQGSFEVQALVDGFWHHVGELKFDRYVRERELTLPAAALAAPRVRVRLVQHGGGAAQIDRVVLGEIPATQVVGAAESDAVALAARRDNDVLDAFGRTIEFTFPGRTSETALRLAARVEPKVNEGDPFAFPPANQSSPMTQASAFYRYDPVATGSRPSWPGALDPSKALFAEFCRPTTGHPDGMTYGWVTNDRETLYAEVEFTSDNTRDGNKDFSSVTVERNGRLRQFRVSEDQTRWGRPSFIATDRAPYHHKLYTFAIPFSELGIRDAKEAGELKLAFNAYGTAATFFLNPSFHDFGGVEPGNTSSPFIVTVINNLLVQVTLDSPYFTDLGPNSNQFQMTNLTCQDGTVLATGHNCTFQVVFAPTVVASAADEIRVCGAALGDGRYCASLQIQGTGVMPVPAFSPLGIAVLALALSVLGYFILRRR